MEAGSYVSIPAGYTYVCMYLIQGSLVPLMGVAYFLQFLDKLALSQATLFNLREDLVFAPIQLFVEEDMLTESHRT